MRLLKGLLGRVADIFRGGAKVDEDLFEDLEAGLIQADVSASLAHRLVEQLRREAREQKLTEAEPLRASLQQRVAQLLARAEATVHLRPIPPSLFLIVGVNGTGKTTTIAKMAHRYKSEGKKVLLAAADTYRAAAIDQLEVWAQRLGVDMVRQREGSDPAAVVYDAIESAKARSYDLVIADTAGRLHTKEHLMEELRKIRRVAEKALGRPPDETLLVLDGTTGQNALQQARIFKEAVDVTGLILTKLDGTAKGGCVLSIVDELNLPIKLVGVGEKPPDLEEFSAADLARGMLEPS